MKETSTEYALGLPGRGWLIESYQTRWKLVSNPDFGGYHSIEEAREALVRARKTLEEMGAEFTGNQLTIVTRTTTVTRSNWTEAD